MTPQWMPLVTCDHTSASILSCCMRAAARVFATEIHTLGIRSLCLTPRLTLEAHSEWLHARRKQVEGVIGGDVEPRREQRSHQPCRHSNCKTGPDCPASSPHSKCARWMDAFSSKVQCMEHLDH